MYNDNLPPGVTQKMIDDYYGPDCDGLEFYVEHVNIYADEIEVEVTWTKDGDSYVWYSPEDCECVSEVFDMQTCFYLPVECKDMNEEQLKDYIETHCNPYQ